MSNVMSLGGFDFNNLDMCTTEQIDMMMQSLMTTKIKKIESSLAEVVDKVNKWTEKTALMEEDIRLEMDKRDELYKKQVEVAVNSIAIKNRNSDLKYVKLTDLGKKYVVNISSINMGTLLRLCGIAWKGRKTTTPKMQDGSKYCIIEPVTDKYGNRRESFSWNITNCMDRIDEWLKDNDLYEEFYSIKDQDGMKEYIKYLAVKYDVAH